MKKRLKKDIVIPAGTILKDAPTRSIKAADTFVEAVIGLTKDTAGCFTYPVKGDDEELLKEWFEDVDEDETPEAPTQPEMPAHKQFVHVRTEGTVLDTQRKTLTLLLGTRSDPMKATISLAALERA